MSGTASRTAEELLAELERLRRRNAELEQQATGARQAAAAELHAAHVELKRHQRFSEALLDAIPNPVFFKDRQGRYTGCNRAFSKQMGVSAEEINGKTVFELWPGEHAARYHEKDLELMANPERQQYEWKVRDVEGRDRDVIFSKGVFVDERGEVAGLVGAYTDVTDLKQAEEELRQARALESIGCLAGGVAHDFNNLLTPIIGYADLLLQDLPGEEQQEALDLILQAAKRAQQLTQQLLAFGRKQLLELRTVGLSEVITELTPIMRRLIREDISLHVTQVGAAPHVKGDRSQLEQVLINLAVNAQDAMPDGGVLTVQTTAVSLERQGERAEVVPGRYARLRVSDTGVGMDKETLERVFEPFYTTKERGHGTGLGLATVYGIIKQHGGYVWATSEVGLGATFDLYFPVVDAPTRSTPAEVSPADEAEVSGLETVVVVEDSAMVRKLAVKILRRHGYEVLEAQSAAACLALLGRRELPVELLLTDVVMPEMDGKQLYEQLSAQQPGLRVLYMSGYAGEVLSRRGVLEQGTAFLHKPFTVRTLLERVRAALGDPCPGGAGRSQK